MLSMSLLGVLLVLLAGQIGATEDGKIDESMHSTRLSSYRYPDASDQMLWQESAAVAERKAVTLKELFEESDLRRRKLQTGGVDMCAITESVAAAQGVTLHCNCTMNSTSSLISGKCIGPNEECINATGAILCSKLTLSFTTDANFGLRDATQCIYNYTRNGMAMDDFCTTVKFCATTNSTSANVKATYRMCSCSFTIGGVRCNQCLICDNGNGIQLNCSNYMDGATSRCSSHNGTADLSQGGLSDVFYPQLGVPSTATTAPTVIGGGGVPTTIPISNTSTTVPASHSVSPTMTKTMEPGGGTTDPFPTPLPEDGGGTNVTTPTQAPGSGTLDASPSMQPKRSQTNHPASSELPGGSSRPPKPSPIANSNPSMAPGRTSASQKPSGDKSSSYHLFCKGSVPLLATIVAAFVLH